jgi:hypothetical protein
MTLSLARVGGGFIRHHPTPTLNLLTELINSGVGSNFDIRHRETVHPTTDGIRHQATPETDVG